MDLAKREVRGTSLQQRAPRTSTVIPDISTSQPAREINAPITRPDTSAGDALAHILGLASEVGQNIAGDISANKDKNAAASGALDSGSGTKDAHQFAKSRAYRDAWQLQGAKKLSIDIGDEIAQKVTARLHDSDHPATIPEVDGLIESIFRSHVMDSQGHLLDFGTPEAKVTLANALNEIRSTVLPQAEATIKSQTDERLMATVVSNKVYEHYRGAEIGAPIQVDTLAPLPGAEPPRTRTVFAPAAGHKPLPPFYGFGKVKPSSTMGAPREGGSLHNGEDFPVPIGTVIKAPMQGTVVSAFSNARGGNQVRVKLADGATVGFAHLSKLEVKQGDTVTAGQQLALSGQTGHATGPHVHMTVEVGGKKVSPTSYFAGAVAPSGLPSGPPSASTPDDPVLAQGTPPASQVGTALPPFDFEGALKAIPSSVDRKIAKSYVLQALINTASQKGDIGVLAGLEDSKRPDGLPTLTPDEIATVEQARQQVSDRVRVQADITRKQFFDKNEDAVLLAFESNKPPSIGFLRNAAHQGLVSAQFAYTMENHIVSEQKSDASQARMEAREARAEAASQITADVGGRIALRQSGDVSDADPASDLALYNSGQLGPVGSKAALGWYRQLRASARAGEQENLKNPEVGIYAGQLKQKFGKAPTTFLEKSLAGGNQVNFYGMMGWYRSEVAKGKSPVEAYRDAIEKFAPKSKDAAAERVARIQELRAKRLGGQ